MYYSLCYLYMRVFARSNSIKDIDSILSLIMLPSSSSRNLGVNSCSTIVSPQSLSCHCSVILIPPLLSHCCHSIILSLPLLGWYYDAKSMIEIRWPSSQSYFYLLFIFVEINFYLLSFLCDVYNKVYEYMQ